MSIIPPKRLQLAQSLHIAQLMFFLPNTWEKGFLEELCSTD